MAIATSAAFERVTAALAAGRCVVLDGGVATELPRAARGHGEDERLWGTTALVDAPADVLAVHRRYVDAGCDVISTNTWGLPSALRRDGPSPWEATRPIHWMDVARRGMRLARQGDRRGRPRRARAPSRSASTATSTRPRGATRSSCSRGCSPTSRPT